MEIKHLYHNGFKIPIKDYKGHKDACLDFVRDFLDANKIEEPIFWLTNEELKKQGRDKIKPIGIYKRAMVLYFRLPNNTEHLAVYLGKGKIATLHQFKPVIMPIFKIKKFIKGGYYVGNS